MKKMRLIIAIVVCVLCGIVTLSGCKANEELTDKDITSINMAYEIQFGYEESIVDAYYGKYNGYIVFEMYSILPAEKMLEIGNQYFWFSSMNELWAFKDNTLVELEKVYDRGDLTDRDIEQIHERYLREIQKNSANYEEWHKELLEKIEVFKNNRNSFGSLKSTWNASDTKAIREVWKSQKGAECSLEFKLGKFDYSCVFMQVEMEDGKKRIEIADQVFTYTKNFQIWVYKDKDIVLKEEIITIEEAFERGYLTKNDIIEIHRIFTEIID